MRTLIDLPEDQLESLSQIAKARRVSRAELVRQAIAEYLRHQNAAKRASAFGLWKDRPVDSLAFVESIRSEWDRE